MSTITISSKIIPLLKGLGCTSDQRGLLTLLKVQTNENERIRSGVYQSPYWWENTSRIEKDTPYNEERAKVRSQILEDLTKGNIDEDVIQSLNSALLNDANVAVRLQAVNLIKERRLSSNETIDALVRCLNRWPLDAKSRRGDDVELFRLSIVETLKTIGNEPALCETFPGAPIGVRVRTVALAKAEARIANAIRLNNNELMTFSWFILCCNFTITLVFKLFYLCLYRGKTFI